MPLITKLVERLSRMDTRCSGFTKELLAVLKNIGEYRLQVRQGACYAPEKKCQEQLEPHGNALKSD